VVSIPFFPMTKDPDPFPLVIVGHLSFEKCIFSLGAHFFDLDCLVGLSFIFNYVCYVCVWGGGMHMGAVPAETRRGHQVP